MKFPHWARWCCPALGVDAWVDFNDIHVPVTDLGFRQAVTAVERMRTYRGRAFSVPWHAERLAATLQALNLHDRDVIGEFEPLVHDLVQRNQCVLETQGDCGITFWLTPDSWALHLNPLNVDQIQRRQKDGQCLVVTDVCQPSSQSWSRQAKVRCRLHYYLADQEAKRHSPGASGVLVDQDGSVTETSTANVAFVQDGVICSPENTQILPGITQRWAMLLARQLQIPWRERCVMPKDLLNADEIFLMGTEAGIWPCFRVIDGRGNGHRQDVVKFENSVCRTLQGAFINVT